MFGGNSVQSIFAVLINLINCAKSVIEKLNKKLKAIHFYVKHLQEQAG